MARVFLTGEPIKKGKISQKEHHEEIMCILWVKGKKYSL